MFLSFPKTAPEAFGATPSWPEAELGKASPAKGCLWALSTPGPSPVSGTYHVVTDDTQCQVTHGARLLAPQSSF